MLLVTEHQSGKGKLENDPIRNHRFWQARGQTTATGLCVGERLVCDGAQQARYVAGADIGGMAAAILEMARDGDVVMCMGAGSIGGVPAKLVETGGAA